MPGRHGCPPRRTRSSPPPSSTECLDRGLIVELGGRHSAVVRLLPPLTITDEQADAVLDRLADAMAAAERRTHRRADAASSRHDNREAASP